MAEGEILVLGGVNWDTTVAVARLPSPGESVLANGVSYDIGGKGLNQAVAAARAGASVSLLGATGDDAEGDLIRDFLTAEGIDTGFLARLTEAPTGRAFITVDSSAENTITIALGANAALAVEHLAALDEAWPAFACVVANMEVPANVIAAAFKAARHNGVTTVLNPSPLPEHLGELAGLTDVLIVNRVEAASLAGDTGSPEDLGSRLRDLGPAEVVITLGGDGSLLVGADAPVRVPAVAVDAVDPTAAGDTYLGYFVAGRARDLTSADAARVASRAAAACVTRPGASAAIPRAEALTGEA